MQNVVLAAAVGDAEMLAFDNSYCGTGGSWCFKMSTWGRLALFYVVQLSSAKTEGRVG